MNAWGLHDVHGNVFEWCADVYRVESYTPPLGSRPTLDPRRLTFAVGNPLSMLAESSERGDLNVLRGGSWFDWPENARSAFRNWGIPSGATKVIGFRLLMSAPDPP